MFALEQLKGCQAIAEAVAMCRPDVICAHAGNPQVRILDHLDELARRGALAKCLSVRVESDAAAMSIGTGASIAGMRTYAVTASQGLVPMAEALYNAAELGMPIVMTLSNCGRTRPALFRNDHIDSMSMRDAGWIQLYADTDQEAIDLHVQAFRLAEALSCPVMVCVDGETLARSSPRSDLPTQTDVDAYLPAPRRRSPGDPALPACIGTKVGPDGFMEQRFLVHHRQLRALGLIQLASNEFHIAFGRSSGGLLRSYRTDDAKTIVVALGSVNGTIREVVDELREEGMHIGSVGLCSFRPFPLGAMRDALQSAERVVVVERSLATGQGGILSDGVRKALSGTALRTYTVIAGLGGRAITPASLRQLFEDSAADELEEMTFLDLNADLVANELEREAQLRRGMPETLWT